MSKQKHGGPAFPLSVQVTHNREFSVDTEPGMSLRDYFAAKAMQQVMGEHTDQILAEVLAKEEPLVSYLGFTAQAAYAMADAMLAARDNEQ